MLKRIMIAVIAALVLGGLAASVVVWAEDEQEREVKLEDLPEAVKEAILEEAGENEILEIEEVQSDGRLYYEADWLEDGKEVEIQVGIDGSLIDRETEDGEDGDDDVDCHGNGSEDSDEDGDHREHHDNEHEEDGDDD